MSRVLVLNQDFTPLSTCSVERAFLLLFLEKADLISKVDDKSIRTVSRSYPFPSIIQVKRYISIPYHGVILTRHNVFKRDGHICQYCGTGKNLTLDHVIPRSRGGKTSWTNLVTACQTCNAKKGDHSLERISMELRKKPTKPSYIMFLKNMNGSLRKDWNQYLEPKAYSSV